MDISHGEHVEKELDLLITRRHEKRRAEEGERPAEEAWAKSERRHDARRREENRLAWCKYHQGQAARHRAVLESLISQHEAEATRLQTTDEERKAS